MARKMEMTREIEMAMVMFRMETEIAEEFRDREIKTYVVEYVLQENGTFKI
jgi:hypothetical protein